MRLKFISKRESIESAALWVAALLILVIMLELITGWSIGGKSSPSQSKNINPEQFWFEIKLHCSLVLWLIFRSFLHSHFLELCTIACFILGKNTKLYQISFFIY